MMSTVGWYGPLIDLSSASLHVGNFVQLLVLVHRSTPVQYKVWNRGEVVRTDIQVGDETRPYFPVSIWQKNLGLNVVAGDIILLQNVKITKFGQTLEGRTLHCSSLLSLVHPYQSLVSKGVDELVAGCRVGITTKEKLKKVIKWVQRDRFTFCGIQPHIDSKTYLHRNWKLPEERKSRDCFTLSEVTYLDKSCKAAFYASIGEMFLPFTLNALDDFGKERMFVSRRLYKTGDHSLVKDLICTGCQLCGCPLDGEHGHTFGKNAASFYCLESSNRLHKISFIYRPLMLYVWDELEHIPLLVKNKVAELLYGNITAERVYSCFKVQQEDLNSDLQNPPNENLYNGKAMTDPKLAGALGVLGSCSSNAENSLQQKREQCTVNNINFYRIWLILLKAMLQQGKNSPLKFEVAVNPNMDPENGRFEMVSLKIPCVGTKIS